MTSLERTPAGRVYSSGGIEPQLGLSSTTSDAAEYTSVSGECDLGRESPAGHVRARPRPLKIEAADPAVDVEDLADEKQARAHPRLHRRRIDLGDVDAAGGHLREVVAARVDVRQRPRDERVHEAAAILARQRAGGALAPKCVQRSAPDSRAATPPSTHTVISPSTAIPDRP